MLLCCSCAGEAVFGGISNNMRTFYVVRPIPRERWIIAGGSPAPVRGADKDDTCMCRFPTWRGSILKPMLNLTVVKTHILADEATAMHLCCPLLGSIALEPLTYVCSPSLMLFNVIALVEDCLSRRLCEDVDIKPSGQPSLGFSCLVNFF
jgi:hypothetical protein